MSSIVFLLVLASVALVGCSDPANQSGTGNDDQSGALTVYTVNYPLQYIAERIGGDTVRVYFPAPTDSDPAHWRPDANTIAAYQQADLILLNGAGYAKWTQTASLPSSRVVNTSAGFHDTWIPLEETVTHSHGAGGEHSHRGFAFTTWLDPQLAIAQAQAIRGALVAKLPAEEAAFDEKLASLVEDLNTLDEQLQRATETLADTPVLFSHPVYQYLESRCALNGKSLHWEPGELPDEASWADLDALLVDHPARLMIWEGTPHPDVVTKLGDRGIACVEFEPCGNKPGAGDYLSVMRQSADRLAVAATQVKSE